MIRHVLLIKFKQEASTVDIATLMSNFIAVKDKITGIDTVEWGENSSPEQKNKGYTHCVVMTFIDDAARDFYLPHPDHEILKAQLGPILEDIIVLDYAL
ncbi:Dabb family protein [Marinomonas transparens]|uniref:Dabb family protein n=1 Tax=Marinomonas transparens TaxID=2795388 RepID=A0A934JQE4_9GAMM|nr:Dabb family protein [Marinomonas transparens]MBJ7537888.1 Dabb family protein [Marinomonas transparens]